MGLFTDEDVWNGGFYELALEYGAGVLPGLIDGLTAVWHAKPVIGCYLKNERDPIDQPRADFGRTLPYESHLYGVATLPTGKKIACGTCCVREDGGSDWLVFYCPIGALGRVYAVGAFPFGASEDSSWQSELDAWLADIGREVFASAPFRLGLIGFETSGEVCAAQVLKTGVPANRHCSVLVPTSDRLVLHPRPQPQA